MLQSSSTFLNIMGLTLEHKKSKKGKQIWKIWEEGVGCLLSEQEHFVLHTIKG